jgi:hypothetical protein
MRPTLLLVLALATGGTLASAAHPTPPPHAPPAPKPPEKPFVGRDTEAVKAAFPGTDRDVLEQPESLELLSIHPYPDGDGKPANEKESFQGYKVLGRAAVTEAAERRALVEAVYKGLNDRYGPAPACFNPRHALRAKKGEVTVDVVICYECETVQVHSKAHPDGRKTVRSATTASGVLDKALKDHKLPKHVDPPR